MRGGEEVRVDFGGVLVAVLGMEQGLGVTLETEFSWEAEEEGFW